MNKRYCSHCGTANLGTAKICSKCSKPISSGLKIYQEENSGEEEIVVIKKKVQSKARRVKYVDEDGNEIEDHESSSFSTPKLSIDNVIIERPKKLTIAEVRNGAKVPSFDRSDSLPADIEVSSRSYFHQEKLD
jgi:hypothetical protein